MRAMYYRKPQVLMLLIVLVGIGMTTTMPALGDDNEMEGNGTYFKGPMATCLSRAKVVYPCVFLSPPAYQTNSTYVSDAATVPELPLDSSALREANWFGKLTGGELWNPTWRLPQEIEEMDMNVHLNNSGNGMNMNLGPMKLNMYLDEVHFSDSRFFLGIDRSW
jgi:hypothetical protein